MKSEKAAIIQKMFRGLLQRRRMAVWTQAASMLQSQVRGLVARRINQRKKRSVALLQRRYRGARVRKNIRQWSSAMSLIQRKLRGRLTRLRLSRADMRRRRVVHSSAAIRRLLNNSTKLFEIVEAASSKDGNGSESNAITWTQYRDNTTDKVFYLRTEHLRYGDRSDTRWEAPPCFEGRFVCGFDDLAGDGACEERFNSELEVETHRRQVILV